MKISAKTILGITSAGSPALTPKTLAPFANRHWDVIYRRLQSAPPPLWLLNAIGDWYTEHGPLAPPAVDRAFKTLLAQAWPKCPVKIPRGRSRSILDDSEGGGFSPVPGKTPPRDEPPSGGPGGGKGKGTRAGGQPHATGTEIADRTATPQGAAAQRTNIARHQDRAALADALPAAGAPDILTWATDDLLDKRAAARVAASIAALAGTPGQRARLKAFYAAVRARCPSWLIGATADGAIIAKLKRVLPGIHFRHRAPDASLAERRTAVFNLIVGKISAVSQCSHSKSAYGERDWMDERATIRGFWDNEEVRALINETYGRELSFPTLERFYRKLRGSLSPAERARDKYIQCARSDKPDYAGEYLQLDGSEIPVHILNSWGRARKNGNVAQIMAALTDVASLRTWLYTEGTTSEVNLWSPLLLKYFREVGSAPRKILTDLGGRLFHQLWDCEPGQPIPLDLGLRVALAAGVQPQNHSAHNARAKGAVECGGIKSSKSTAKRLLVSRLAPALFRELPRVPLDSHGHVDYRQIESQADWKQFCIEWETLLNSRLVHRVDDGSLTRQLVWDLAEYAARRAERELAADWQDRYRDITRAGYCMEVRGQENRLFFKGARAELIGKLAEPCREGSIAVLFPGGMRKDDELRGKEFLRGIIIEGKPQGGLLTYHAVEANQVSKTFLGWESDAPKVGEPPKAIPETEHERHKRLFVAAGRNEVAKIRAAKATVAEGTTGEALRIYE